ncbi:unnamed protein product [Moneuplotes crassus]|uniref:Uncharacterized protein n=1 Tax=Euplotes crassus TaxID=5936 RepID=A0AAD2DA72_EUPCR|nr:unnamed protein product [Moneuplotes crassus]
MIVCSSWRCFITLMENFTKIGKRESNTNKFLNIMMKDLFIDDFNNHLEEPEEETFSEVITRSWGDLIERIKIIFTKYSIYENSGKIFRKIKQECAYIGYQSWKSTSMRTEIPSLITMIIMILTILFVIIKSKCLFLECGSSLRCLTIPILSKFCLIFS